MKFRTILLFGGAFFMSFQLSALDVIGNLSGLPDATSVRLQWSPYTGTMREYRVLRDGIDIGHTISRKGFFTDYGLAPSTTYSYEVHVLGLNGEFIGASPTIQITTTANSTIKTHYSLLAIVFNPNSVISQSELNHTATFLNFRLDFLKYASHNSAVLDIYSGKIIVLNSNPPVETNSSSVDYRAMASTHYPELDGNSFIDLIEMHSIDLVWVIGTPPEFNFAENVLMGNRSLGNETWPSRKVKCSRSFFINSNLPDARAFDAAAHHVEGTMTSATEKSPSNWPRDKEYLVYTKDRSDYSVHPEFLNLFERFRLTDEWTGVAAYASKGNANCGSSHFVPGSIRSSVNYPDYTYYDYEAWVRYVDCYADDWLSYPQFSNTPRKLNGYDFGAYNDYIENDSINKFAFGTASFHYWWFNHIPHNAGVSNGKLNNWWPYIYDCNRFDGTAIDYTVDGFPVIPSNYEVFGEEYGTEENGSDLPWSFWNTFGDFGQRADLSLVNKSDQPGYVKSGEFAIKVDIDIESFSINGRNDVVYPFYKNAHWDFSNADSLTFSIKFDSQELVSGTNPIIRICQNGNNRIEFIPKNGKLNANFFNETGLQDDAGWYTFRIPVAGNEHWEKNLIGYIDPAVGPSEQAQRKQELFETILNDVNYFEISVQCDGNRGESLSYYLDNLKVHFRDTASVQSISSFSLISRKTGSAIIEFTDSITLDIADIHFSEWNLQANTSPENVGSVVFTLDSKIQHSENKYPYTLKHLMSVLKPGLHNLLAEVYSKAHGRGEKGVSRTAIINVINSSTITYFTVVDPSGNVLMKLNNGDNINIADPAFRMFSIQAGTTPENVRFVIFWLNGHHYGIEREAPYMLNGKGNGKFRPWVAEPGNYTLLAIPYVKPYHTAYAGKEAEIHFQIVKENDGSEDKLATTGPGSHSEDQSVKEEDISIAIFPNPVAAQLHVIVSSSGRHVGDAYITVRDWQGQVVYNGSLSNEELKWTGINASGLAKGVYYLEISDSKHFRNVVKFIKE